MIWTWDDGTDIATSYGFNADGSATEGAGPWSSGEPNESGGDEDCVEIRGSIDGKYNDVRCSIARYPLCNKGI